jgi:hypothetical protein
MRGFGVERMFLNDRKIMARIEMKWKGLVIIKGVCQKLRGGVERR